MRLKRVISRSQGSPVAVGAAGSPTRIAGASDHRRRHVGADRRSLSRPRGGRLDLPDPDGHLQALGTDAAGRRQYLYHEAWRSRRNVQKFHRVERFAEALPAIAGRVRSRAQKRGFSKDKSLALAVRLLDEGSFRSGSESYARDNGTFGLATIRRGHVKVEGSKMTFDFTAKSGKRRVQVIEDARLARVVRALKERQDGNHELLAYEEDGRWHDIRSSDINGYLQELAGDDFTAKDFRTWQRPCSRRRSWPARRSRGASSSRRRAVTGVVKEVAEHLGEHTGRVSHLLHRSSGHRSLPRGRSPSRDASAGRRGTARHRGPRADRARGASARARQLPRRGRVRRYRSPGFPAEDAGNMPWMSAWQRTPHRLDDAQQRHPWSAFPAAVIRKFGDDGAGRSGGADRLLRVLLVVPADAGRGQRGLLRAPRTIPRSKPASSTRRSRSSRSSGTQIRDNVGSVAGSPLAIVIGIGGALWAGLAVVSSVKTAMDEIWDVPRRKRGSAIPRILRAVPRPRDCSG